MKLSQYRFVDPSERCAPVGWVVCEVGRSLEYSASRGEDLTFVTVEDHAGERFKMTLDELAELTVIVV